MSALTERLSPLLILYRGIVVSLGSPRNLSETGTQEARITQNRSGSSADLQRITRGSPADHRKPLEKSRLRMPRRGPLLGSSRPQGRLPGSQARHWPPQVPPHAPLPVSFGPPPPGSSADPTGKEAPMVRFCGCHVAQGATHVLQEPPIEAASTPVDRNNPLLSLPMASGCRQVKSQVSF